MLLFFHIFILLLIVGLFIAGSFSIPFATVFSQGRVDGVFRLDVPAFNMGYHSGHERKMRGGKKRELEEIYE